MKNLIFRTTSVLRFRWARDVTLPRLEELYEQRGLSRKEYQFYENKAATLQHWERRMARSGRRA